MPTVVPVIVEQFEMCPMHDVVTVERCVFAIRLAAYHLSNHIVMRYTFARDGRFATMRAPRGCCYK
jgi:hypothetical protein